MTTHCIALLLLLQKYPVDNPYKADVLKHCSSQIEFSKVVFEIYQNYEACLTHQVQSASLCSLHQGTDLDLK
jgi:hypothetical protein